jgi:hypothetical protein
LIIGPGAHLEARSDILGLENPPYLWTFDFTTPDTTAHWQQLFTTNDDQDAAVIFLLWNSRTVPSDLLSNIHANPGDSIRTQVTVRNQANQVLDQSAVIQIPWQPAAWSNLSARLYSDFIVSQSGSGAGGPQLDRIESAVYQVFPHA